MQSFLLSAVRRATVTSRRPDGTPYQALPHCETLAIARRNGAAVRLVEMAALADGILPRRYARNTASLDATQQARLLASRVALVGLGAWAGRWWKSWPGSASG